jgi:hypothetical protein
MKLSQIELLKEKLIVSDWLLSSNDQQLRSKWVNGEKMIYISL